MVLLTREQLEQRLVALHRASLKLVRDLSLEAVLDGIVQIAHEQSGAKYAALGVMDKSGQLEQFIPVGMTTAEMGNIAHLPQGRGLIGAIADERRTIRISDIESDPRSVGFPAHHAKMRSFLGVPILLGDNLIGQIYLTDKQDHTEFTEDDERVIETLAAYAAVAINNARLYEGLLKRDSALSHRNNDLALINSVAATLASSLEVDEILEQTFNKVMSYLDLQAGEIFLYENNSDKLHLAYRSGDFDEAFSPKMYFETGEGFIGMAAKTGKPLISTNLKEDMRYLRKSVFKAGFKCIACIPLQARGSVIGVMSVATKDDRHLEGRELNLLTAIGTWAGITIENAQLHDKTTRVAVLEERERIGMDLHDGIIQSIYGVGLALEYARVALDEDPTQSKDKIEQAIDGLNNTIRDIRAYILDLRPRQFDGQDLREGLECLVDEFRANTLAEANIVLPENGISNLPNSHSTVLFHVCQEALANIAKHSQANQADVRLWTTKDRVLLEVSDNGKGFDLEKKSVSLGHGLSNMHIRARKVGGDVEITSIMGEGATVLAWVPRRV